MATPGSGGVAPGGEHLSTPSPPQGQHSGTTPGQETSHTSVIVVGIVVPLVLVAIGVFIFYVCYRKKYPVRMVIGKDFSRFTNPAYSKRASTLTLVRNDAESNQEIIDDLSRKHPTLSLVREDDKDGIINEGFINEDIPESTGETNTTDNCKSHSEIVKGNTTESANISVFPDIHVARERPRRAILIKPGDFDEFDNGFEMVTESDLGQRTESELSSGNDSTDTHTISLSFADTFDRRYSRADSNDKRLDSNATSKGINLVESKENAAAEPPSTDQYGFETGAVELDKNPGDINAKEIPFGVKDEADGFISKTFEERAFTIESHIVEANSEDQHSEAFDNSMSNDSSFEKLDDIGIVEQKTEINTCAHEQEEIEDRQVVNTDAMETKDNSCLPTSRNTFVEYEEFVQENQTINPLADTTYNIEQTGNVIFNSQFDLVAGDIKENGTTGNYAQMSNDQCQKMPSVSNEEHIDVEINEEPTKGSEENITADTLGIDENIFAKTDASNSKRPSLSLSHEKIYLENSPPTPTVILQDDIIFEQDSISPVHFDNANTTPGRGRRSLTLENIKTQNAPLNTVRGWHSAETLKDLSVSNNNAQFAVNLDLGEHGTKADVLPESIDDTNLRNKTCDSVDLNDIPSTSVVDLSQSWTTESSLIGISANVMDSVEQFQYSLETEVTESETKHALGSFEQLQFQQSLDITTANADDASKPLALFTQFQNALDVSAENAELVPISVDTFEQSSGSLSITALNDVNAPSQLDTFNQFQCSLDISSGHASNLLDSFEQFQPSIEASTGIMDGTTVMDNSFDQFQNAFMSASTPNASVVDDQWSNLIENKNDPFESSVFESFAVIEKYHSSAETISESFENILTKSFEVDNMTKDNTLMGNDPFTNILNEPPKLKNNEDESKLVEHDPFTTLLPLPQQSEHARNDKDEDTDNVSRGDSDSHLFTDRPLTGDLLNMEVSTDSVLSWELLSEGNSTDLSLSPPINAAEMDILDFTKELQNPLTMPHLSTENSVNELLETGIEITGAVFQTSENTSADSIQVGDGRTVGNDENNGESYPKFSVSDISAVLDISKTSETKADGGSEGDISWDLIDRDESDLHVFQEKDNDDTDC